MLARLKGEKTRVPEPERARAISAIRWLCEISAASSIKIVCLLMSLEEFCSPVDRVSSEKSGKNVTYLYFVDVPAIKHLLLHQRPKVKTVLFVS